MTYPKIRREIMYKPSLELCIIFIIISHLLLGDSSCLPPKSDPLVPALYIFGDSLIDNGNNNLMPTAAKANFAPYGIDFPCPMPVGRFSNGRTPADFIAEYLGLPYPPPFASLLNGGAFGLPNLTPNFDLSNLPQGYNYASAMCGILRETGSVGGKCNNFDEQIDMFQKTVESQLSKILQDPTQLSDHLSKSIFFISMGNNDYLNNYLSPIDLSYKLYTPSQFAQLLLDTFSRQLRRLYDLGARKVVLTEVSSMGCMSSFMNVARWNQKGRCDEDRNSKVSIFNQQLPSMLSNLESTLEGSYFNIVHSYSWNYDVITNPAKYGITDSIDPCCPTMVQGICVPGSKTCTDRSTRYFWDAYHPTEAVYSLITEHCIFGTDVCLPMNIKQLVEI